MCESTLFLHFLYISSFLTSWLQATHSKPSSAMRLILWLLAVSAVVAVGLRVGTAGAKRLTLGRVVMHMSATDSVPLHIGGSQLRKRGLVAPALFAASAAALLMPRLVSAQSTSYLKEATPAFVEDKARALKYEADGKKVRKVWDGLLAKLEAAQSAEELEVTLGDMKKMLKGMPYQIPAGAKKIDLVKTARQKKFLNPASKSKKTKPAWTTNVEIEYQALIQQWNRNFSPDNSEGEGMVF